MNTLLNRKNGKLIKRFGFCLNSNLCFNISYLQKLYEFSKQNKSPFFKVDSHHIRIIQDPLDYYISLKKGIQSSSYRIALSCLYLGTDTLERYLLRQIKKKKQSFRDIDITMVFDYNRSLREEKGQSSAHMLHAWKDDLGPGNIKIAFNRNSYAKGVLGQIMGVHHQKMAIFDNKVIIGGANMSKNYFLNRKDRYMQIKQCDEMSNYLTEYLKILAQNSYQYDQSNKLFQKSNNLKQHAKIWQISYRPPQYKDTIGQQQKMVDQIAKQIQEQQKRNIQIKQVKKKQIQLVSRNEAIARQIGTSIKVRDQIDQIQYKERLENARQRYFILQVDFLGYVDRSLLEIKQKLSRTPIGKAINQLRGERKCIYFHLQKIQQSKMHYPKLNITKQPQLFHQILKIANINNHNIMISSGYLNLSENTLKVLSETQNILKNQTYNNKVQILCSAPQANSFYEGGRFKKYIPYFYRCFQIDLFKRFNKSNKISIFQFNKNDEWSFHSKGVWIKQAINSYLTVLGSSNYNGRSQKSDIQLQLYMYSTCQKFNKRLDRQYQSMKQYCSKVDLQKLQNDQQIKCTPIVKFFSRIFKRFL